MNERKATVAHDEMKPAAKHFSGLHVFILRALCVIKCNLPATKMRLDASARELKGNSINLGRGSI
jgi:hypothetical protein